MIQKRIDLNYTVDVKDVINQIQAIIIGASHATAHISETTFQNGRQATKKWITLFKTLKFTRGITIWY